jgi:hypothetical protein
MAILLEHRYTPQAFKMNGIRALKGIDNDRYNMLRSANEKLADADRFDFNVAHACLTVESYDVGGGCDYYGDSYEWEENERSTEIKEWYDAHGKLMANLNNVNFSSSLFDYVIDVKRARVLDDDDFEAEKTFGSKDMHEDIDGYTGNEGVNKTTLYNRYLMILLSKKFKFELYCKANLSFAVEHLSSTCASVPVETLAERLSKCVAMIGAERRLNDRSLDTILRLLPMVNDLQLVREFLKKVPEMLDVLVKSFALVIVAFGWDKLEGSLVHLLDDAVMTTCKLVKVRT